MAQNLKNSGLALINQNEEGSDDEATYIVIGVPRSGTSMVATALKEIGIFIGDVIDDAVFEDVEIANALEKDTGALLKLIEKRNTEYPKWGFKRPEAFHVIGPHIKKFRNPKFIITFRDPVAIAKRNEISVYSDFIKSLSNASTETARLIKFISELSAPAMLVSYEKAMSSRALFLNSLLDFCGVELPNVRKKEIISLLANGPDTYLDSSRIKLEGCFDRIKDGVAIGWARKVGSTDSVKVEIRNETGIVAKGVASEFREDLVRAKKNEGYCAFTIKLPNNVNQEGLKAVIMPFNYAIKSSY